EEVDQGAPAQRVELLDLLLGERRERLGAIEQTFGFETIEVGDREQMLVAETGGARARFFVLHASRSLSHARLLSAVAASEQARRKQGGDNRFSRIGAADSVLYLLCSMVGRAGLKGLNQEEGVMTRSHPKRE